MQCGLLGKKLGHSYSPAIHNMLASYDYDLFERQEDEVAAFLQEKSWSGLNVTIPYKRAVVPFMDCVSETVKKTGSINTVVRRENGELYGDNTDVFGFLSLVKHAGINAAGKKALILGSGGASASVRAALEQLGAQTVIISRSGEDNYENLEKHADARLVVNTTPVGMYPDTGKAPLDLRRLPQVEGVLDIIYNPARTAILLQAEQLGIPHANGLYMLVAQAKRSAELFSGKQIADSEIDRITRELAASMQNIVLIGMPGCGKSTIAEALGRKTGREVVDSDVEIFRKTGLKPSQIILEQGEAAFRDIECEVLAELGKKHRRIISTGGGSVLREENYNSLHQNGCIVWIQRELSRLSRKDRPLSQNRDLQELYEAREPRYRRFADFAVDNCRSVDAAADEILTLFREKVVL
ncbi:MAG: AAA family ATPase [Clostridia bacterium]|nr:AAA family ATPase [Clostridia bacterium]